MKGYWALPVIVGIALMLGFSPAQVYAATFNLDFAGDIVSDSRFQQLSSTFTVSGESTVQIVGVRLSVGDSSGPYPLLISIRSPTGTLVSIHSSSISTIEDVLYINLSSCLVSETCAPVSGPGTLNDFVGQDPNGTWDLLATDLTGGPSGGSISGTVFAGGETVPWGTAIGTQLLINDIDGDGFVLSTDCNDADPTINPGATEVCNGQDDDCNAATLDGSDEVWFNQFCDGVDSDLCQEGIFVCSAGSQVCSDTTGNNLEVCNGQDDDCNAATVDGSDETWFNTACDGPDADTCAEGTFVCNIGSQVCTDTSDDTCGTGSTFCGDGARNGNEVCEGTDLGGNTCAGQPGFTGGTLACTATCGFDTSACTVPVTGQITGSVEILATCGLQFVSGTPISYGGILPGAESSEQQLVLDNTGNTALTTLFVRGSNWVDSGGLVIMDVSDSRFSTSSTPYASKTTLGLADKTITSAFDPVVNQITFWQLTANLLESSFAGDLTQTMDFIVSCDVVAVCGNNIVDIGAGETCDDGNTIGGDGCSATCQLESVGAFCGDGVLDAGEVCDDGNTVGGDGCSATCQLEAASTSTIHVSQTTGTDNASCGDISAPCMTISFGLTRAVTDTKSQVHVADGLYQESVTLIDGINLRGAYDPTTWLQHIGTTLTIIEGTSSETHKSTILADTITSSTLLEGFIINGQDNVSGNSYGIRILGSNDQLVIRDNRIFAGFGGNGVSGGNGVNGINGADGSVGSDSIVTPGLPCSSTPNQGGSGGTLSCGGTNVSGGNGGATVCPVLDVETSEDGLNGQSGGGPLDGFSGSGGDAGDGGEISLNLGNLVCFLPTDPLDALSGTNGGTGTNGFGGPGCSNPNGVVAAGHWTGGISGNGGSAGHGGGAGGGGGGGSGDDTINIETRFGAAGGGGGSGACGGSGASGGAAGGGSFGIFVVGGSSPTITNNDIQLGFGGTGGNGGFGAFGGTGGSSGNAGFLQIAPFCQGIGGSGANGGNGGAGGGGGGACGGGSYGIYTFGVAALSPITGNVITTVGTPGAGGAGGTSPGNTGGNGLTGLQALISFN